MVPGVVERERRIADAQRRDWLAEAFVSPARTTSSLARGAGPSHARGILALKRQRRLFSALRDLQLAINVALRKSTEPIAQRSPAE